MFRKVSICRYLLFEPVDYLLTMEYRSLVPTSGQKIESHMIETCVFHKAKRFAQKVFTRLKETIATNAKWLIFTIALIV
jgi:hypothetical protein